MRIQSARALERAMRLCAHYCTNPECTVGAHSLPAIHAKPSANKPYICEQFEAVYPKLLYLAIFMQCAQLTCRGATSRTGGSAQESPSFATSTFFATVPVFATENGARCCPSRPSPRRGRAACATENGVRRWRRKALSVERALRTAKMAHRPTPGGCQLPSRLPPCRSSRPWPC